MIKKFKLSVNERALVRRYLIWCYKTTKESLDRVDRYYTQLRVDQFLADDLLRTKPKLTKSSAGQYDALVVDFQKYMLNKKTNVDQKKFIGTNSSDLQPGYLYLQKRLSAIEKAIIHFLGKKDLNDIVDLYEKEMTHRILSAREHD